jgi:hypothetical protein
MPQKPVSSIDANDATIGIDHSDVASGYSDLFGIRPKLFNLTFESPVDLPDPFKVTQDHRPILRQRLMSDKTRTAEDQFKAEVHRHTD